MRTALASAVLAGALAFPAAPLHAQTPRDVEIAFLEGRVDRDDADPITPARLGHAYLQRAREGGSFSDYAKAEAAFRLALARSPDHFGALTGLAQALAARHAFGDAYEAGKRAIGANPDVVDGYAVTGDAALEAGMLSEAAALYAEVSRRAPGYHADTRVANLAAARGDIAAAHSALARAAEDADERDLPAELRAWPHIRSGALAYDHGDFDRAERGYKAALQITPDSDVALEHLAELRAAQGRDGEALALYGRAIGINPRPEYHEAVGAIYRERGEQALARAAFESARRGYHDAAEAGDPGAYRPLALFYADVQPQPAEAIRWARKDLEIREDPVTLGVLAWTLMKAGQSGEAAAIARRAAEGAPVDALTWSRAGCVALATGDEAEGRRRLARARELNPRLSMCSPDQRERD